MEERCLMFYCFIIWIMWLLGRSLLWHLGCFMFYPFNNVLWKRKMFLIIYCFILWIIYCFILDGIFLSNWCWVHSKWILSLYVNHWCFALNFFIIPFLNIKVPIVKNFYVFLWTLEQLSMIFLSITCRTFLWT